MLTFANLRIAFVSSFSGQGSPLVGWCGPESSRNEAYLLTSPVLAAAARAGGCQVSVGANEADTAGGAAEGRGGR